MDVNIKKKFLKSLIITTSCFVTIASTNLIDMIQANEFKDDYQEKIILNKNLNSSEKNNSVTGDGTIDMRNYFVFKASGRMRNDIYQLNNLKNTAEYISRGGNKVTSFAKILSTPSVDGKTVHKQTVFASSNQGLNLNRDFEVEASFAIKEKPHGFIFSIHGEQEYQPMGTDDALGVYFDPKKPDRTRKGIPNAFIMEVDTYNGDERLFGDKETSGNHVAFTETDFEGKLSKLNLNNWIGNMLQQKPIESGDKSAIYTLNGSPGTNNHVKFIVKWNASSKQISVNFLDNRLTKFNLSSRYIDNLAKLQKSGKKAYISIGGTSDNAGQDFMEIEVSRIKYLDLDPRIDTHFYDKIENKEISSIYPGQEITVRHDLFNKNNLSYDIADNIKLNLLYLQFLNDNEIAGTIKPGLNLNPYNIRTWKVSSSNRPEEITNINKFDTQNPIFVKFPSNSRRFIIEYDIKVPTSVDKDENYAREFYLYFLTSVGENGYPGAQITDKHLVRLNPKIESRKGKDIRNKHEVYLYDKVFDGPNAKKSDALYSLWEQLFVTSSTDRNFPLSKGTINTPGTRISYKYFYKDKYGLRKANENEIPDRIPKSSSITLCLEIIDKKNENLKSYYYRTIIVGDKFMLSDDGNYLIFGNHMNNITDTLINIMNINQFKEYIKENSNVSTLYRNSANPTLNFSDFILKNSEVQINNEWNVDGKIDIKSNNDLTARKQSITVFSSDNKNVRIDLDLTVESNAISNDNGKENLADGTTGYVIIPSKITVLDDSNQSDRISGIGDIYLSDYSTNKNFYIWSDKNITLKNKDGDNVMLTAKKVNGSGSGPDIGAGKEYLGIVNRNKNKNNPLKIELSGRKFKNGVKSFIGSVKFYIQMQ